MPAKVSTRSLTVKAPSSTKSTATATDTTLDTALVEKAVKAVLKYHENASQESSGKLNLLGDDRPVHVQFTLLRAPSSSQPKPTQIVVPHPFFKLADQDNQDADEVEEPEICLIVKESSKPWCQEMIEKFPEHMGGVKKVLTLDSLRKKYTSYQQKRELLHKYNMFMADDRILPMLSKALGKAFIQTKRLPIPVDLTRQKALPFAIQKALSATYMTINKGNCITIRAGHTGMDAKKIVENIVTITEKAVPKMPRKWSNIQLIGVKTADSVSLPVYNKTPEALREIAQLAGLQPDVGMSKNLIEKDTEDVAEPKNKKKRTAKSPLLQALKKQKKEEKVEEKSDDKQAKKKKAAAEKKAKADPKETANETKPKRKNSTEKESSKKKKKPEPTPEPEEETESPKKKQKVEKTKKSKTEEPTEKEDEGAKKEFIKARKFKGSKKGYVFKMGREGLGYYVDVKPVVDRDAMEAIARLGKNKSRRGGQKKNKYKGTRRF